MCPTDLVNAIVVKLVFPPFYTETIKNSDSKGKRSILSRKAGSCDELRFKALL